MRVVPQTDRSLIYPPWRMEETTHCRRRQGTIANTFSSHLTAVRDRDDDLADGAPLRSPLLLHASILLALSS